MPKVEPVHEGDPAAVGPYRLIGRLGAGGQGVVYLGQAPDGRLVAVKVLRDGLVGDDRFAKEVAAARRVEPFCIAQVLDASLGGRPYIVTEYVEGPSLQQTGRHTGADLQRLAVATATALAAIHRAGVVHRDFKPANVLLGRDGPRVIDFGIARTVDAALTVTSSVVGTPAYMAPEQLAGVDIGYAADVFAWASVIVSAATGAPPFGNDSMPAVIKRILHDEPWLGDLPEPLRSIVYGCLAKDPMLRPTMQDVLFQLIGGTAPLSPRGTAPPRGRRRAVLLAGGSLAVSSLVVAAAVVWLPSMPGSGITGGLAGPSSSGPATGTAPITATAGTETEQSPKPARTQSRPGRGKDTGDAEPTPGSTARPTSSARPTTTGGGMGSVKILVEGENLGDCWRDDVNFYGVVPGSGKRTQFTYRWLFDSQNLGRTVADTPAKAVFPAPHLKTAGSHKVTFRVITPVNIQKSVSVTICGPDKDW
ncbi:hypothetical protein FHR32_002599 [Streptosporangium album]|uniref:non-specific serine/threonine protein kinase n=1 Tax=Streptosporangium album TaxID=47479 RepID=A0A7W7W9P6_9ACTN|nr:serine/threonine-protein kinase [Streptosporangium album]MBB4938294.1 hypothetical protein [Streptosporangium album]